MDQVKIGKFIAECRKEKGYTQASLAEKLMITDRAVSKWETGKSLPDSSIMLELCELLSINVNELLKGEHIDMEEYGKASEEIILSLKRREEEHTKFMLHLETVMGIICVLFYLVICFLATYVMESNHILGVSLIVVGVVLLIAFGDIALRIEQRAGYYQCVKCGHRYVPTYKQVLWAPHIGRSRYMKCPCCGEKSYQKKRVSEEDS